MKDTNPENSKNKSIKKPNKIIETAKKTIADIQSDEEVLTNAFMKYFRKFIRNMVASGKKFMKDNSILRATSISYALIVSFVPALVVLLLVGAKVINTDEYFSMAKEFTRKNGIPLDLDPYINIIKELLQNATAIGGVGFLVMLFSATGVLRNVEESMNTIWRVHRPRPMLQKISGFLMAMIFGPVLLTIGISYAQLLLNQFASPDLYKIKTFATETIALGDKGVYASLDKSGRWMDTNLVKKINFDYQNQNVVINSATNEIIQPEKNSPIFGKMEFASPATLKTAAYHDMDIMGNRWFVITSEGTLIKSYDSGETWMVTHFQREELNFLFPMKFQRIRMFNNQNGIILGSGGLILYTDNGGDSWMPSYIKGVNADFLSLSKVGPEAGVYGIIGTGNSAFLTRDYGRTWAVWDSVKAANPETKADLMGISLEGNTGWIVGRSGTLLYTVDGGITWERKNMSKDLDFRDVKTISEDFAVMVGDNGDIRYSNRTVDGKIQWLNLSSPSSEDLYDIEYHSPSGKFFIVGSSYNIISNYKPIRDQKSSLEFSVIKSSPIWRSLISAVGNVILPFAVIWVLFFVTYKVIPNTFVSNKAASIGAAATSFSWVIFLLFFKLYASSFSKGTFAVYGTLAAIPLLLLLVNTSAMIMLFGAEIAFFVQFPMMIRLSGKKMANEEEKRQIWYGIKILYTLAKAFQSGKGPVKEADLLKITNSDQAEFLLIINKFKARGYVTQSEEKNTWLLAKDPDLMEMEDIISDMDPSDYDILGYDGKDAFMKEIRKYFDEVKSSKNQIFGKITFGSILKSISEK